MVRNAYKSKTVNEAKQRLRATSARVDYFGVVRKHPMMSVGAAFLAGMVLSKFRKEMLPPGLVSLGVQLLKRL